MFPYSSRRLFGNPAASTKELYCESVRSLLCFSKMGIMNSAISSSERIQRICWFVAEARSISIFSLSVSASRRGESASTALWVFWNEHDSHRLEIRVLLTVEIAADAEFDAEQLPWFLSAASKLAALLSMQRVHASSMLSATVIFALCLKNSISRESFVIKIASSTSLWVFK